MKKLSILSMKCVIFFLRLLYNLGKRSKLSGWRKSMGIYLRREESKFVLTAFNLKLISKESQDDAKQQIIGNLVNELRNDTEMHWAITWRKHDAYRIKKDNVDIIHVTFDEKGKLLTCIPYLDEHFPVNITPDEWNSNIEKFIFSYNKTLHLSDEKRPKALEQLCPDESFYQRLLTAHLITFSEQSNENKFTPVNFINMKHFGLGLLNIHVRLNLKQENCDLWIQYQHIAVDGVPMQNFLNHLKINYRDVPVIYPNKNHIFPIQQCSDKRGKNTVFQTIQFIPFQHMIEFRKKVNSEYQSEMGGKATFASLLIWALGNSDPFRNVKFMFPVEVPADLEKKLDSEPSGVFIRPSDFFDANKPFNGLLNFQHEFNHEIAATRQRASNGYKLIEYFSLLPPFLYKLPPTLIPDTVSEFVGGVGVTILRDSDIFIPPSPLVQPKGFFAIGNLSQNTASGELLGCVGIKATKNLINDYTTALKNIDIFYAKN